MVRTKSHLDGGRDSPTDPIEDPTRDGNDSDHHTSRKNEAEEKEVKEEEE